MKKIAILGSTGSIGTQTLEVARENGDLQITALAAGNNIELLEKQIREFHPGLVAVWKEEKAKEVSDFLTIASLIERQYYPVNAKYHLSEIEGLHVTLNSRTKDKAGLTETFKEEVKDLSKLTKYVEQKILG